MGDNSHVKHCRGDAEPSSIEWTRDVKAPGAIMCIPGSTLSALTLSQCAERQTPFSLLFL